MRNGVIYLVVFHRTRAYRSERAHATTGQQIHPMRAGTTIYIWKHPFGTGGPFSYAGRPPSFCRLFCCRRVRFCGRSLSQKRNFRISSETIQHTHTHTHVCCAVDVPAPIAPLRLFKYFHSTVSAAHHCPFELPVPALILCTRLDLSSSRLVVPPPSPPIGRLQRKLRVCVSGCTTEHAVAGIHI